MTTSDRAWGRWLVLSSQILAILGVLIFVVMVGMIMVSIVGRKLVSAPVQGDVEILQMAAAVASSCFFAYGHLHGGDMKIDFFTARLHTTAIGLLEALSSLFVGIFGVLLTWRTGAGAYAVYQAGETSAVLGWPVWVAQTLMLPGLGLLGLAGCYTAWIRISRKTKI